MTQFLPLGKTYSTVLSSILLPLGSSINDISCKMRVNRIKCSCFSSRAKCFIIGYLHLISSLVDIGCHLVGVAIVTGGFQCDVDINSLQAILRPWLQVVLLVVNLGTHGFYPLPMTLSSSSFVDYAIDMPLTNQPKCYPGMLHVYLIDILNFLINIIWLRLVISFIAALHKKDPEQIRMFFGVSIMKLALQVIYISFHPSADTTERFWLLEILDICIAASFLIIINNYIRKLRMEQVQPVRDQPPSYIECLISASANHQTKTKTNIETAQPTESTKNGDSPAILPI